MTHVLVHIEHIEYNYMYVLNLRNSEIQHSTEDLYMWSECLNMVCMNMQL